MRNNLIFIFLFIFSISSLNAQEEIDEIVSLCQYFKYQELSNGLENLKKKESKKVKYIWDVLLDRELVNDYFEQVIEFNADFIEEGTNAIFDGYQLKIRLLKSKDGRIAYYKIVRMKYLETQYYPSEIIIKVDSDNILSKLKKDFFNAYSNELDFNQLFN